MAQKDVEGAVFSRTEPKHKQLIPGPQHPVSVVSARPTWELFEAVCAMMSSCQPPSGSAKDREASWPQQPVRRVQHPRAVEMRAMAAIVPYMRAAGS